MSYSQAHYRAVSEPVVDQNPKPAVSKGREDYPDDGCPECGIEIPTPEFSAKHSIVHFGELELRNQGHLNLTARQRQAYLSGWPIPER